MTPEELQAKLDAYCQLREALGFRPGNDRYRLRAFLRFWQSKGCPEPIRAQIAVEWACLGRASARRLQVVRGFLSHLRTMVPETEVPDPGLVASYRRPQPYIFTTEQIQILMSATLQARPRGTLRPHTFHTLIGLLASTGLRPGEAFRLTLADVQLDLHPARLCILNSKFQKSRLVPLHPTTADQLRHYLQTRQVLALDRGSGAFFVSHRGGPFPLWAATDWFRRLTKKLGWRGQAGDPRPVLTAFRHTFAVQRMVRWYDEGADVGSLLPHLSVYLGHLRPQESYWYLSATPDLLRAASQRFQLYSSQGGSL